MVGRLDYFAGSSQFIIFFRNSNAERNRNALVSVPAGAHFYALPGMVWPCFAADPELVNCQFFTKFFQTGNDIGESFFWKNNGELLTTVTIWPASETDRSNLCCDHFQYLI